MFLNDVTVSRGKVFTKQDVYTSAGIGRITNDKEDWMVFQETLNFHMNTRFATIV